MGFAVVNAARLAWQQLGEGPDVLLVHGLAASRAFWFAHATRLARRCRVTLFDLRGHGYSELSTTGYSAAALGADIVGLMDALEIPQAALLAGHSYGGAAALEAALQAPQRFDRLALFDTRVQRLQPQMRLHDIPRLSDYEIRTAELASRHYGYDWETETQVGFRFLEATARLRADGLDGELRDSYTPFGEGRGASRTARQWLKLLDETGAREEFLQPGADTDRIAALDLPTLLMYAEDARCLPSGTALRELLGQARYVGLANAGHFFPVTQAARVTTELDALLDN